jgi:hypothetical protein
VTTLYPTFYACRLIGFLRPSTMAIARSLRKHVYNGNLSLLSLQNPSINSGPKCGGPRRNWSNICHYRPLISFIAFHIQPILQVTLQYDSLGFSRSNLHHGRFIIRRNSAVQCLPLCQQKSLDFIVYFKITIHILFIFSWVNKVSLAFAFHLCFFPDLTNALAVFDALRH